MQHHEDEVHISKKTLRIMYWMLHFSEAKSLTSRVRPCWPCGLKLHKRFLFGVFDSSFQLAISKDILPFDLGFCCAANRVKALAWVEQMQWRQPFQGEHAVCFSGVDAEMHDPQHIPQSEAKSSQHVSSLLKVDQGTAKHSWPEKSDLNEAV